MGYACYIGPTGRDQGYGVPAKCDHPDCDNDIDRGVSHACGGDPMDHCGLFFCGEHLYHVYDEDDQEYGPALCERCHDEDAASFEPKPDVHAWIRHKLTDKSWAEWRRENADWVAAEKGHNESSDDFTQRYGSLSTTRHEDVRWRYGENSGDGLIEDGVYYDGLTIQIECASWADAQAMIEAIGKT